MSHSAGHQPNPYQPPALDIRGTVETQGHRKRKWTSVILFAFISNGIFPFYGFFVHANSDH